MLGAEPDGGAAYPSYELTLPFAIHIYTVCQLDPLSRSECAGSIPCLRGDDVARAGRMGSELRWRQFVTGRRLMWTALADLYGERAVASWHVRASENGRPFLWDPERGRAADVEVSISHSGSIAACAIGTQEAALGLDVETRARRNWKEAGALVFSEIENVHLAILEEADRAARCAELWCLKEAFVKAVGTGLTLPLSHVSFSPDNRLQHAGDTPVADATAWRFALPYVWPEVWCAVAWLPASGGVNTEIVVHRR